MKICWRSISGRSFYVFIIIFQAFWFHSFAQRPSKGDFYFPIRPGEVNYLSGSMGEIRSNHFHAGIDIKTGGIEGLPVYAAADGYVSRIKVSTGGYGNALYIEHPNSTTTVYAHLLKYNDEIAAYVRQKQYEKKSFEIELFPGKDELPVKKAQVIGLSGNSGSSGGPHLHFEIRDHVQDVLNPLHFGFEEIRDKMPPSVDKIAFVPLYGDSRINHQFLRHEYPLYRSGNAYSLKQEVLAYGYIGIQVLAYDRLDGAANKNGISCIDVLVNGEEVFYYNISKFAFSETRNIFAHIDHRKSEQTGERFQKLYIDDGNELSAYKAGLNKGRLLIEAGKEYQIAINFYDSYGNHSKVEFKIKGQSPVRQLSIPGNSPSAVSNFEAEGNMLKITATTDPADNYIQVYCNQMPYDIAPEYMVNNTGVYLWNMNAGLPDSIRTHSSMIYPGFQAFVPSGSTKKVSLDNIEIVFPKDALFDTLLLSTKSDVARNKEYFAIGDATVPLKNYIYVALKPALRYPKDKTGVYRTDERGRLSYCGGEWTGELIKFSTREFGRFTLIADTVPPSITAAKINSESMAFYIKDELSGIRDYEMTVNGEWVLMNYDYKKNLIWSEKLDPSQPFKGEVVLKVADFAGNENILISNL